MSKLAKGKKLWTMIDNTFASPVNQNPVEFGIDVVIHSGTKYLGGHSDILAGAIVTSNEHMKKIIRTAKNLGGSLSDSTVWLLERSMKTLFIRVAAQNQNAQKLADHLEKHELISKVNYPGLMSHPQHELAIKQMKGFGGMLSFELMPNVNTSDFFKNLKLIKPSMSLAGVESTLLSPRLTSHASLTETERKQQGITEQLIRFSVGIEDVEDLKNDLNQALINAEKNNKL
jgi:cystathionine beta-lyase